MRLALRETLLAFRRAPLLSALSVTTIAFSLFTFGLFGLVALNIRSALRSVEERVEIRAFLADSTPVEAAMEAARRLREAPGVGGVTYVSPQEAVARAQRELTGFGDLFEDALLPASLEVQLAPGARDPATVRAVAERASALPIVEDVRYGEEWVRKLDQIRRVATATGIVLGLAFAAVALIIIASTIRMTVLARAEEIGVMRLVGATDAFIRLPFLLDGLAKGILGGLLALALTWLAHAVVDRYFVQTVFFRASVGAAGVLCGAVLGLAGSAISVGRQLRLVARERRRFPR
jgi:cell division transport system permease protein